MDKLSFSIIGLQSTILHDCLHRHGQPFLVRWPNSPSWEKYGVFCASRMKSGYCELIAPTMFSPTMDQTLLKWIRVRIKRSRGPGACSYVVYAEILQIGDQLRIPFSLKRFAGKILQRLDIRFKSEIFSP